VIRRRFLSFNLFSSRKKEKQEEEKPKGEEQPIEIKIKT